MAADLSDIDSQLPEGWLRTRLGAAADFINGDRGENYPTQSDRVADGVPFINTGHIEPNGRLSRERMDYITRECFERLRSGKVMPGDILYCLRGSTIGKTARNDFAEGAIASSLVIVRAKEHSCQEFLYYYLTSPLGRQLVAQHDNGSAQPNLSVRVLSNYPLALPPLREQRSIAKVLGAIDDKIELNRKANRTLAALAEALFKSWFVDFDPVRAKGQGRTPTGMDSHTAKLFSDELVESELGPIPKGWRVASLAETSKLTMGQSPPGETYNERGEGAPFFQGSTDFGSRFPSQRVFCSAPTRLADAGDTLVSVRAPVGALNMAFERCAIGRGVAALRHRTKSRSFTYYLLHSMRSRFAPFDAEGTVFGSINKAAFEGLRHVEPPREIVLAFDELARPLDDQIEAGVKQSSTLGLLRNSLLPRLLSGEVRVPTAE